MSSVLQDVRFALRLLLRSPGITFVCVMTLGLAIGASTAIFSVVSAVTLEPLPYRDPDRLVRLYSEFPSMGLTRFAISPPEYFDLRREPKSFEDIGACDRGTAAVAGIERPIRVPAAYCTHTMLPLLGVAPLLGRTFAAEEDRPGDPTVIVLGYELWQRGYGGDPDIIGKQTTVDAMPMTIVGVMPPGFDFPEAGIEAWLPAALDPALNNRGSHRMAVFGRLASGVTLAAAQAEAASLTKSWGESSTNHRFEPKTHPLYVYSLTEEIIGPVRPALWLLQGAVLVVLLIAVANIANLLLARAEGRSREVAVRAALGAEPSRLIRQFLTESIVLGVMGGAVGLLIAVWGVDLALLLMPEGAPRTQEIHVDGMVLAFAATVAVGAGVLFGLAPLVMVRSDKLHDALKAGGRRTTSGKGGTRLRNSLVIAETAMALILVVGCGVLLRSFVRLSQVELGFQPAGLLSFELELPSRTYPEATDSRRAFWLRTAERLRALPGVQNVTLVSDLPPVRRIMANDLELVGRTQVKDEPPWNTDYWTAVGDDAMATMGFRLLQGRALTATDDAGAPSVVMINEAFAKKYFPGENPIGKQIKTAPWDEKLAPQTVVGVIANVKQGGLEKPAGTEVLFNIRQDKQITGNAYQTMSVVLQTAGDPMALAPTAQRVIREIDPQIPVARLRTVDKIVWGAAAKPRFLAFLVSVFAGLALLIAGVGVYGVMSYSVAQRTQEIGIRMALGAPPASIRRMILGRALLVAGIGCVLGIAGAIAFALGLSRAFSTLLYETSALDPITLILVPIGVLVVAGIAAWFPARRATKVDPMTCLRSE